jgi:hypothetical protein
VTTIKTPLYIYAKASASDIIQEIDKNKKVAVYSFFWKNENESPWYKVIYDKDTGYIKFVGLKLGPGQTKYLNDRKSNGENLRLQKARKVDTELMLEQLELAKQAQIRKENALKKAVSYGIVIPSFLFIDNKNSIDFWVRVYNPSEKTMKYLWITTTAYNRVKDLIGSKTVEVVGPIEHQQTPRFQFENTFYSKVFGYGKISKIKIQYMDGSIKEFSGAKLEAIVFSGGGLTYEGN